MIMLRSITGAVFAVLVIIAIAQKETISQLTESMDTWKTRAESFCSKSELLRKENESLKAKLAYWECERLPEKPLAPTPVDE